jgi:hypothetical protein
MEVNSQIYGPAAIRAGRQLPLEKRKISEEYHLQGPTRRRIPEDDTLHNHRCENLKSYIEKYLFLQ